jgi:hypothetical protein
MYGKKLGYGLLTLSAICFVVAIIGMIFGGSYRWTEPFQHMGWIFFIPGFLVLFFQVKGRKIINPDLSRLAWILGAVSIVLFLIALIFNAASASLKTWFEAFETAGSVAMLAAVVCAVLSIGDL